MYRYEPHGEAIQTAPCSRTARATICSPILSETSVLKIQTLEYIQFWAYNMFWAFNMTQLLICFTFSYVPATRRRVVVQPTPSHPVTESSWTSWWTPWMPTGQILWVKTQDLTNSNFLRKYGRTKKTQTEHKFVKLDKLNAFIKLCKRLSRFPFFDDHWGQSERIYQPLQGHCKFPFPVEH